MRALLRFLIFILFGLFAGVLSDINGQGHEHLRISEHPVFQQIDAAVERGQMDQETALLQKFRYAYSPYITNSQFPGNDSPPVKCMVPVKSDYLKLKDQLSISAVIEIEQYSEKPLTSLTQSYLSESGNFILYYETEGFNSVPLQDSNSSGIPDYVEKAAFAADSSYRYQVEQAGFLDFRKSEPYEIYFQNFGFYGTTNTSGSTTFIRLHNNFEGFPPNSHPEGDVIGALYATVAHEIKHAIQYETNRWQGDAGSFDWIEMDATLMEEVVFPDVNDYFNYIKEDFNSDSPNSQSIFGNPGNATPGAYWHMTWMLYFYEEYGIDFWVDVWEQFIEERTKPFFEAIQSTLAEKGLNLGIEHLKNHKWHMTSGPESYTDNFGFAKRESYPNPSFFTDQLNLIPDEIEAFSLQPYAANYIWATPPAFTEGQPRFSLQSTHSGVGIGLTGFFLDGSIRNELVLNPESNLQSLQTTWNWSELDRISIAVVNTNAAQTANYRLEMTSTTPDEDFIAQNYPNPFNPSTRITFSINENKHIRLEVFDSIGRRVTTLLDQQLESGYHTVDFDGTGLSSGIYFYRIVTDNLSTSKKMLLVK
jgi:hypothetical protein